MNPARPEPRVLRLVARASSTRKSSRTVSSSASTVSSRRDLDDEHSDLARSLHNALRLAAELDAQVDHDARQGQAVAGIRLPAAQAERETRAHEQHIGQSVQARSVVVGDGVRRDHDEERRQRHALYDHAHCEGLPLHDPARYARAPRRTSVATRINAYVNGRRTAALRRRARAPVLRLHGSGATPDHLGSCEGSCASWSEPGQIPVPSHHGQGTSLLDPPRFEITVPVPRHGGQGTDPGPPSPADAPLAASSSAIRRWIASRLTAPRRGAGERCRTHGPSTAR